MKLAITGHTRGLGKALFDLYPDAKGFSKSDGYDISDPSIQAIVSQQSAMCDVFVNNAYCQYAQVDMLYKMYYRWKDDPTKTIVCISSISADVEKTYPHPYAIHKAALTKACSQLRNVPETKCRIICVSPGWIDTERARQQTVPKINTAEIAEYIQTIIELRGSFYIPSVTIIPTE